MITTIFFSVSHVPSFGCFSWYISIWLSYICGVWQMIWEFGRQLLGIIALYWSVILMGGCYWVLGSMSPAVHELTIQILWQCFLGSSEISYDQIMPQLCTCHDSWAVMACANLWPDMNITCLVKLHIFLYGLAHRFINCSWTGSLDSRAPERSGLPIGTLEHTIILLMIFPYGMLPSSYRSSYRWMWEFHSMSHKIYTQFLVHCFLLFILVHLSRFVTIHLPMFFMVIWVGGVGFFF